MVYIYLSAVKCSFVQGYISKQYCSLGKDNACKKNIRSHLCSPFFDGILLETIIDAYHFGSCPEISHADSFLHITISDLATHCRHIYCQLSLPPPVTMPQDTLYVGTNMKPSFFLYFFTKRNGETILFPRSINTGFLPLCLTCDLPLKVVGPLSPLSFSLYIVLDLVFSYRQELALFKLLYSFVELKELRAWNTSFDKTRLLIFGHYQ